MSKQFNPHPLLGKPPFPGGKPPFPMDGTMNFTSPGEFIAPPLADVSWVKRKFLNVPYANRSQAQLLDVFLPDNGDGPFPTLVYIHGGGFALGDKRDGHIAKLLDCLAKGYALAAVEYRLSGEAIFPAAVQDCKAAVRFLRAHAADYHLDPTRFGSIGGSAGGNLSAMLAASAQVEEFNDATLGNADESCSVQAAVDWFGPTDFLLMDEQAIDNGFSIVDHNMPHSAESCYIGKPLAEADPTWVKKANPITYIGENLAPILIEHGSCDRLVPSAQSKLLYEAICKKLGERRAEYHVLEGADHEDSMFESDENMARVWAFFDKHLHP